MTNTRKYTDKDYSTPYASGIAHLLPITLPFVEDLKRGEYTFQVEETTYQLEESEYEVTLHNSWGQEYYQKQKGWKIVLIEGEDKYGIISKWVNQYTTKADAISRVNDTIKESVYNHPERKEVQCYEYKDFVADLNTKSDADKVMVLKGQIEAMADGMNQYDALAYAYGYVADKGAISTMYVEWSYVDQVKSKRRTPVIF